MHVLKGRVSAVPDVEDFKVAHFANLPYSLEIT